MFMIYSRLSTKTLLPAGGMMAASICGTTASTEKVAARAACRSAQAVTRLAHQQRAFSGKIDSKIAAASAESPAFKTTTVPRRAPTLMDWYEGHLNTRPVVTKMVTGSLLWGIGDAVAQMIPQFTADEKMKFKYDIPRTGRAVFFGFALHAPLSHVHFNFLEWMTVRAGLSGYGIPVFKTIMEQFVYWSWFSNSLYHAAMGAMQGMDSSQIYKRVEDVLWETQVAQWKFWIPIQLLNFQFVPVRHQLNVVLLTSIVWTALLSAWYPPAPVKDAKGAHEQLVLRGAQHD